MHWAFSNPSASNHQSVSLDARYETGLPATPLGPPKATGPRNRREARRSVGEPLVSGLRSSPRGVEGASCFAGPSLSLSDERRMMRAPM